MNFNYKICNITPFTFTGVSNKRKAPHISSKEDEFVKSDGAKYKKALEYAKNACIEKLEEDCPYEYSVAISKNGGILYENPGEESHCNILYDKLEPETTIVHGHPSNKFPLSPQDIITFLSTPNIKTIASVCKNGKSCSMTKPENFRNFDSQKEAYDKINEIFIKNWLDCTGVSYELDDEMLNGYEARIKEHFSLKDEDFQFEFYYGNKPKDPKEAFELLKMKSTMMGYMINEPYIEQFLAHSGEVKDNSETEIEILKKFLNKVSEKYGTKLEYN